MAQQRERLLAATASVVAREETPSVAAVIATAGVGRNTFYEYFDDVAHAVRAARSAAVRRIDDVLRDAEQAARTPIERWRALSRAWLGFCETEPSAALLALERVPGAAPLGGAGTAFQRALERSLETLRHAGITPPAAVGDRLLAAAAAAEALARAVAGHGLALEAEKPPADGGAPRERLESSLVDVLVRLLR